jgi:hypothetical protein
LDLLNKQPKSKVAISLSEIIELANRADSLRQVLLCEFRNFKAWSQAFDEKTGLFSGVYFHDSEMQKTNEAFNKILSDLNAVIRRYRWVPDISAGDFIEFALDFQCDSDSKMGIALYWLTDLIRRGLAVRIRQCLECRNWFYAIADHQRYCGENCRKSYASHSLVFKEKRRQYMQNYRSVEKEREQAAKLLAATKERAKK